MDSKRVKDCLEVTIKCSVTHQSEHCCGRTIQVAKAIKRDRNCELIVGGEGGYLPRFRVMVEQAGIEPRVRFLGRVAADEKDWFFGSIDVLVLPSLNSGESYGQVLIEAQLRGVPVIASDIPTGVREICNSGRCGLLFEPGNVDALCRCLKNIRETTRYTELSSSGLERAKRKYSEPSARSMILDFYHDLLEN